MLHSLSTIQSLGGRLPPRFPTLIVGTGDTAFISKKAWWRNLPAETFDVKYGCVSPKRPEDKIWFAANARVPEENVSTSLQQVLRFALDQESRVAPLVMCVCTPTPLHVEQICTALDLGVELIISDKPVVITMSEAKQIQAALARHPRAVLAISFIHVFNGAVAMLREIVSRKPEEVKELDGGFLQDWLYGDPKCQQGDWRTAHPLCGLLDIGSHVAHGLSTIAGSQIVSVEKGMMEAVGPFALERKFSDHGTSIVAFENGLRASLEYHQSRQGHADDIHFRVKLTNGQQILWRMAWGPESLFVDETGRATLDSFEGWKPHLRGHSPLFSKEVNDQYEGTPGGHIQGWPSFWRSFFDATAGLFYRAIGSEIAPYLPPPMLIPVPTFGDAGLNITRFIAAHAKSAADEGRTVNLAELE